MTRAWEAPVRGRMVDRSARTTFGNAIGVARAARSLGVDEVVLVTSSWHARRASALVRAALAGSGTSVRVATTDEPNTARRGVRELAAWVVRAASRSRRGPNALGSRGCVKALALLALAFVVAVAASCGGSDEAEEDPTAAWASGFCTAVTSWTDELESITSQFSDTSNLSQEGLESAADDAKSATEQLVDDLRGLGSPETDSGEEVQSAVDELSTTLENEAAKIEETADGVSGLTDLPSAITTITTSLSAMATAFSDTLTTIQDADVEGELGSALEDSPDCAEISS